MWLWGLFLALAGAAFIVRRRGRRFETAALLFFAVCTAAVGLVVFYACAATAPSSMGLGGPPGFSAARLTTVTCLGNRASVTAGTWTVIALSCSAALGLVSWGRSRRKTALRAGAYVGAALLLLVAAAAGFGWFFGFSWCSSMRLF
jgi:hypothetical protein